MRLYAILLLFTIIIMNGRTAKTQLNEFSSSGESGKVVLISNQTFGGLVDEGSMANRMPVRVVVAKQAALAYQTAGAKVASMLVLPLETSKSPLANALNIGPPEFVKQYTVVNNMLDNVPEHKRWDLMCEDENGTWFVTGATPFATAHAALTLADWLRWDEPMSRPYRKVRKPVFNSMTMEFDDWTTGWGRLADGFDMEVHVADAVRVGIQALEVNLIADAVPIQVRERRVYEDMYQWWCIYSPGLDMFFESDLTRGTYTRAMLNRNLEKLKATVSMCRKWGITPTFITFEPRVWPERLYDKYPDLRGARVDNLRFSAEAEYAPDVNHPWVLKHYAEMMTQLMEVVPDLGLFSVWAQDSNAGFPWAKKLYAGPNGPVAARRKPVEESVTTFMTNLRDVGRKVNPDLQLTICASWFNDDEPDRIAKALPEDIGISYTTTHGRWKQIEKFRLAGIEPQVQIEQISNPWKPLGPVMGIPSPWLAFEKLSNIQTEGHVQDLIHRGGIQTEAFVPNFITNEVLRAFMFEGSNLDVDALIIRRAKAWTKDNNEAEALVKAWRLCDSAVRDVKPLAWSVNFISGRTLWRRLVRPIVPNQSLLTMEDKSYYERFEFTVGATDPGWIDNFYMGWSRMVRDDVAHEALSNFDNNSLPKLREAIRIMNAYEPLSETARDVRDRIRAFNHMLTTDRNLIEVQEAIHACLAENKMHPEKSLHRDRIRLAMENELDNLHQFIELLESSPSKLIQVTSGVETTFIHRAPFSHLLKLKLDRMVRHMDDPPGPWFDELTQPGGWTSDLHDKLFELSTGKGNK